ncbi:hypothetical protein DFJ74DRAFT_712098 [Hyaloraphidium curvatum]|nr:hypothetical protein DFJ74DRAFT_712098 [Hyaloraphidium curvatum]
MACSKGAADAGTPESSQRPSLLDTALDILTDVLHSLKKFVREDLSAGLLTAVAAVSAVAWHIAQDDAETRKKLQSLTDRAREKYFAVSDAIGEFNKTVMEKLRVAANGDILAGLQALYDEAFRVRAHVVDFAFSAASALDFCKPSFPLLLIVGGAAVGAGLGAALKVSETGSVLHGCGKPGTSQPHALPARLEVRKMVEKLSRMCAVADAVRDEIAKIPDNAGDRELRVLCGKVRRVADEALMSINLLEGF